jgi:hypothetical protein
MARSRPSLLTRLSSYPHDGKRPGMGVGSRRAWQPRLAYITGSVDQELYLRQTTTPENTRMILRFQADADLHQIILHAVIRRAPTLDFQTAEAAGLVGLRDPTVLAFHG